MIKRNKSLHTPEMFDKSSFVPKLVISVLVPLLFFSVAALLPANDELVLVYMLALTFVCTVIYLIPFASNVFFIKSNPNTSLKPLMLSDLLFVMLPSCFSAVILACLLYLFGKGGDSNSIFAIILCVIFVITPPLAWCFYWLKKKMFKLNQRLGDFGQKLFTEDKEENE